MIWVILSAAVIAAACFFLMKKKKPVVHEIKGAVYNRVCKHCGTMLQANEEYCPNCLEKVE